MLRKTLCCIAILCTPFFGAFSQKQITYKADWSFSNPQNEDILVMIGNVEFQHEGAVMYCDSAELNIPADEFYAFRSVRLVMDTITVSGDLLHYSGISKTASMKGDNVVLQDKNTFLHTQTLNYNRKTNTAYYPDFGTITDPTGTMTSQKGTYNTQSNIFHFIKEVNIKTSSSSICSDSLEYNANTHLAYFMGNTNMMYDDNTHIFSPGGTYNTSTNEAWGGKGSIITNKQNKISAGSIYYNRQQDLMQAFHHVTIQDTLERITITGNYAQKNPQQQRSFVTDSVCLRHPYENDTLFLTSDTLFITEDSLRGRKIEAFHRVNFFHRSLQGSCDSMVYFKSDSLLYLFKTPILWVEQSQITADTIKIKIKKEEIHSINFLGNPILIQLADSLSDTRFNQMSGKLMTAFFREGKLHRVDIDINAKSIYYLFNDRNKDNNLMGVNIGQSSNMTIIIERNNMNKITARGNPSFTTEKEEKLSETELRLKNFQWHPKKRPLSVRDIFISRHIRNQK